MANPTKQTMLNELVKHVDIKAINSTAIIDAMRDMSFASRETARASDIFQRMIKDKDCSNILTLAGSTSAGGCMQVYVDMVDCNMVDAIVSTG
ncbi:MAG: deoxyhypusine synthase family protein, partial [Bacteroidales bacterium]